MGLREQMEDSGNWLFQRRSYLPLAMAGILLIALRGYRYPYASHRWDSAWDALCLGIAFLGLAVRAFTVAHVPRGTSGRNTKGQVADALNTTGIYSTVRHPLYLGNFIIWFSVSIFPQSLWYAVLSIAVFFFYYERIMMAEEGFLRGRYGAEFEEWAKKTPLFIPNLALWTPPALGCSWKTVLRREYSGFFGVVATFTALEIAATYVVEGVFKVETFWAVFFLVGFAVFITLRTLKKMHRLDVQGR